MHKTGKLKERGFRWIVEGKGNRERLTIEKCGNLLIKTNDGEYRSPCFGCENINECNIGKTPLSCGFTRRRSWDRSRRDGNGFLPPADTKPDEAMGAKKEAAKKVKTKRKTAGDIIKPYVRQGLSDSEIAKKTGIKYGTVWVAAKKIRERLAETKGKNADRHLCKTCKYRAAAYNPNGSGIKCEYALKSGTKRSRGCDVEDCDKYEKGAPLKVKDET